MYKFVLSAYICFNNAFMASFSIQNRNSYSFGFSILLMIFATSASVDFNFA